MMEIDLSLILLLKDYEDTSKIARISQTLISQKLHISQTNVSYRLRRLIKHGAIEKCKPGQYRVLNDNIHCTPYALVFKLMILLEEKPEEYQNYKFQSESLNVSIKEIQQAWGFLNNSFK